MGQGLINNETLINKNYLDQVYRITDYVCKDEELSALRTEGVWRENEPMEYEAALQLHPDAHFAPLHAICGIKNAESTNPEDHIHKARVVFGGHIVKDAKGEFAIFDDGSNTPSSMGACRVAIACARFGVAPIGLHTCVPAGSDDGNSHICATT